MPGRIYSRKRSKSSRRRTRRTRRRTHRRSFPRKRSCPYNRTRSRSRRRRTRRRKSTRGGGERWDSFKRAITPTRMLELQAEKAMARGEGISGDQSLYVKQRRKLTDERKKKFKEGVQTAAQMTGEVVKGVADAGVGVALGLMAMNGGRKRRSRSRRGGSPACPNGKIRRKSYTRKSRGRSTRVKSACVPDKGKRGKTPKSKRVLPKLTPGKLGKYGYHDVKHTPAATRRHALEKAVKDEGYAPIVRRLNVIRTYNKNNQDLYKVYDSDMKWMQRSLKPKYAKSA